MPTSLSCLLYLSHSSSSSLALYHHTLYSLSLSFRRRKQNKALWMKLLLHTLLLRRRFWGNWNPRQKTRWDFESCRWGLEGRKERKNKSWRDRVKERGKVARRDQNKEGNEGMKRGEKGWERGRVIRME